MLIGIERIEADFDFDFDTELNKHNEPNKLNELKKQAIVRRPLLNRQGTS